MGKVEDDRSFLPDFCSIRMVFAMLLSGELLALLITLTSSGGTQNELWFRLGLVSVYVQWMGLSSAAVLCVSRRWLRRIGNIAAGITSYLMVLAVCFAVAEGAFWVAEGRIFSLDHASWSGVPDSATISMPRHFDFLARSMCVAAIVAAVMLRYLYVQHQWKIQVQSEARARIQALQSRIRPHFLFNSMNTIASLTRSQPTVAEQVTEDLADLFRESLADASVHSTLGRELEICRQYLRIEEQRLGERLSTQWQTDSLPMRAQLPRLSLQPLVENAIYHGVEPAANGGTVEIAGRANGSSIELTVRNTLCADRRRASRRGNQLAQANVAERLAAFFGSGAEVSVREDDQHYAVSLRFPAVLEPTA